MDLQIYYQKIRDMEAKIADQFALVISNETSDGGKDGRKTEVPRRIAAKMVVEGLARLANAEEVKAYKAVMAEAKRMAEQAAQAAKLQFTVVSTADLERLKAPARNAKE